MQLSGRHCLRLGKITCLQLKTHTVRGASKVKKVLNLPLKTVSVNSTHFANKSHGLRPEAKEWLYAVFYNLSLPGAKEALADLRAAFDPAVHGYSVDIRVGAPKDVLYNKAGGLSSRMHDLSNIEKPLIDALFLPKFFGTNVPYECENLNVDDKYLVRLSSEKVVASNFYLEITIGLIALPK